MNLPDQPLPLQIKLYPYMTENSAVFINVVKWHYVEIVNLCVFNLK